MTDPDLTECKNLILVAGHAVYTGEDFDAPADDSSWLLQPFQKGEPPFYIEHIKHGVKLAHDDPKSLLVFSGGQTRIKAGPRSEAQSYWQIADHFGWWQHANVKHVATTEEYAQDSFQNVLFGIGRFYECARRYPETVTVVSWIFKAERFDLHRKAICFPDTKFKFEGVNNPVALSGATKGEDKVISAFKADPYGNGDELSSKRASRNPFSRTPPYSITCPSLVGLLQHQGPEQFAESIPW